MSDIKTVEFYYKQEFVIIDQKKYAEQKGVIFEDYDLALAMHKRLKGFDDNKHNKLN